MAAEDYSISEDPAIGRLQRKTVQDTINSEQRLHATLPHNGLLLAIQSGLAHYGHGRAYRVNQKIANQRLDTEQSLQTIEANVLENRRRAEPLKLFFNPDIAGQVPQTTEPSVTGHAGRPAEMLIGNIGAYLPGVVPGHDIEMELFNSATPRLQDQGDQVLAALQHWGFEAGHFPPQGRRIDAGGTFSTHATIGVPLAAVDHYTEINHAEKQRWDGAAYWLVAAYAQTGPDVQLDLAFRATV